MNTTVGIKLDERRRSAAARRCLELRADVAELERQIAAKLDRCASMERTWGFDPNWNPDLDSEPNLG